ncbi:MAG: hypothetical protein ACF8CQ_08035 [Rhodopirellula sp. JB044]
MKLFVNALCLTLFTESLGRRGGGLRDLVELVVLSEAFRGR